jgi:hypothetical protein
MGYSAGWQDPCVTHFDFFDVSCTPAVSLAPYSWGRIKALYTGPGSPQP